MELLLEISGAGKAIDKLLISLEPKYQDLEQVLPLIQQFKSMENDFKELYSLNTKQQNQSLINNGYAILSRKQKQLLYDLNFNKGEFFWSVREDIERLEKT